MVDPFLPILSAGLAAVITHALTRRRAVEDARRELRLTYLVEAYRHIERASNRRLTPEVSRELEAAVGDVFLLGTDEQTMLARDFCESMATGGGATRARFSPPCAPTCGKSSA